MKLVKINNFTKATHNVWNGIKRNIFIVEETLTTIILWLTSVTQ